MIVILDGISDRWGGAMAFRTELDDFGWVGPLPIDLAGRTVEVEVDDVVEKVSILAAG